MKKRMISILCLSVITVGSILYPFESHAYYNNYTTNKYISNSVGRWTYKYIDGKLTRIFVYNNKTDSESVPASKPDNESVPVKPDSNINADTSSSSNTENTNTVEEISNSQLTADETKLIQLINQERQKVGLTPLQADMDVVHAARLKSQDMAINRYFSHNSPTYGSPWDMLKNLSISYKAAGENIAINGSISKAHGAFMASSGHKANILSKTYTHVGVGIAKQTNGTGIIITEIFIKK